jgi:hypothetical protein
MSRRIKPDEVERVSGVHDIQLVSAFRPALKKLLESGNFAAAALDLFKHAPNDQDAEAHRFARELAADYPYLCITNVMPQFREHCISSGCGVLGNPWPTLNRDVLGETAFVKDLIQRCVMSSST